MHNQLCSLEAGQRCHKQTQIQHSQNGRDGENDLRRIGSRQQFFEARPPARHHVKKHERYHLQKHERKQGSSHQLLLTLLHLGVKGIRIGPAAPAFVSPNVLTVLQDKYDRQLIGDDPLADLRAALGQKA